MLDRIRFLLNRFSERLWVRPLFICLLSIAGAFLAHVVDGTGLGKFVPEIKPDSIETLLTTISASMLVIATFAVSSMVGAYASASSTATPRSFTLVIADDGSQNALGTFIGAFIFAIVALVAMKNGYYGKAGRFALFALTVLVFAIVITTFVRWVDSVARLGRLGATIDKVEKATAAALQRRRSLPTLRGLRAGSGRPQGQAIYGDTIGYVHRVDTAMLQAYAEKAGLRVHVVALPGNFAAPGRAIAFVTSDAGDLSALDADRITKAFVIGDDRIYDEDPRFGLIVLSEISSRALSPAVNDPGTAIDIIGTFVRLFAQWAAPYGDGDTPDIGRLDRVTVPELRPEDLFDDAFTGTARDGAGSIEVAARLQKALRAIASLDTGPLRRQAFAHSRLALQRAELALTLPHDLETVRELARWSVGTATAHEDDLAHAG